MNLECLPGNIRGSSRLSLIQLSISRAWSPETEKYLKLLRLNPSQNFWKPATNCASSGAAGAGGGSSIASVEEAMGGFNNADRVPIDGWRKSS